MSQTLHKENQTPTSIEDQPVQLAISSNGTITAAVNTTSQSLQQVDVLSPGTVFICFPNLASELQYKIWKIAATQLPRVLALHESRTTRTIGDLGRAFIVLQRRKSPQPTILQVNRKNRFDLSLLMWSTSPKTASATVSSHSKIFFGIISRLKR
jgi:hypothetical protein